MGAFLGGIIIIWGIGGGVLAIISSSTVGSSFRLVDIIMFFFNLFKIFFWGGKR